MFLYFLGELVVLGVNSATKRLPQDLASAIGI